MRIVLPIALFAVLVGCQRGRAPHATVPGVRAGRADTVDILAAVWQAAASGHAGRRAVWLYLPQADSASFTASAEVRTALMQRGIPASTRLPAGDDTVVFRVRQWATDSGGAALLTVGSSWTTVLGTGTRRCRKGSGNSEHYRAQSTSRGWSAKLSGPVLHGDSVCRPIP